MSVEALVSARPQYVLVLTWDIAEEVIRQLDVIRKWGGRFVIPLPTIRVVE